LSQRSKAQRVLVREILPMNELIYDLSKCTKCALIQNLGGETVEKNYQMPSGEMIALFKQEDDDGYCVGAEARIGDLVLGKAEILHHDFEGLEIEETHFSRDGNGRIVYKARSKFGGFGRKTDETHLEGNKVYELFPDWF